MLVKQQQDGLAEQLHKTADIPTMRIPLGKASESQIWQNLMDSSHIANRIWKPQVGRHPHMVWLPAFPRLNAMNYNSFGCLWPTSSMLPINVTELYRVFNPSSKVLVSRIVVIITLNWDRKNKSCSPESEWNTWVEEVSLAAGAVPAWPKISF